MSAAPSCLLPFRSFETYDELYDYCYRVAGTVALMSTPIMGVDPSYKVCGSFLPSFLQAEPFQAAGTGRQWQLPACHAPAALLFDHAG